MTKRTRYFLAGSVGFLVVGLSIGVVAFYGGGLSRLGLAQSTGIDELKYVPGDAVVVAYANVADVMHSEFRQRMKQVEPAEAKGREEFQTQTGINIETDIDRVVACVMPGTGGAEKNALVLVSGRFDEPRLAALAREHDGTEEDYQGRRLYSMKPHGAEQATGAMTFIKSDLVAVGSKTAVQHTIDVTLGKGTAGNVTSNPDLMKMIQAVDNGNAWAVGRFDVLANQVKLPDQYAKQVPAITWFSASGRVNGGVSGTVSVEAKDADAAKNLSDVVNGFIALAKLQTGPTAKPEMQEALKSLQLMVNDKTVAVSFSISPDMLDILKSRARHQDAPTTGSNPPQAK
jgi:hypothetical protein